MLFTPKALEQHPSPVRWEKRTAFSILLDGKIWIALSCHSPAKSLNGVPYAARRQNLNGIFMPPAPTEVQTAAPVRLILQSPILRPVRPPNCPQRPLSRTVPKLRIAFVFRNFAAFCRYIDSTWRRYK
jgi:hypothetical protein